ncbi:hypothetical protein LCGC14_2684690 [marine sediment metagenome]|uniref:Uncharacterized protein n=1 Tax=marine sediment metagenome TaxID=412755 RepID=A0A0F8ZKA6_9ZZZZ
MNATDVKSKDLQAWAEIKMLKQRLPLPKKPKASDPEFAYPEDPGILEPIEIGQYMSRFTAWFNYATSLLGRITSELVLVEAEYRREVDSRCSEVLVDLPGKPTVKVIEAEVLKRFDELGPLYKRRLQLLTIKETLEARARIYERGYSAMSRELSRREMEAKLQ